jgi:hypothetical protein
LLVTEDFAFKTRSYKQLQETFHFNSQPWREVLYGIDVFINLNTADFDWVAVYMMLEKNYVNNWI